MLKVCVEPVHRPRTNIGRIAVLSTQSTNRPKYLTSQVFFVQVLSTAFNRSSRFCTRLFFRLLLKLRLFLYTLSPLPNNEAIN